MDVIAVQNPAELARTGARLVGEVISANPRARVMPATGNTPMGLYAELAASAQRKEWDASGLQIFQLDDYLGLNSDDPRSLYRWMKHSLLLPLGIDDDRVITLSNRSVDPETACRAYDQAVAAAGGIDLTILGLGLNGHLGFNEPPSGADAPTRVVQLSEESLNSNAAYWGGRESVPRQAITAGMTVLLAARQTILLVFGERKREILRRALYGPVTPEVPASFLQRAPNVTVIADRAAYGAGDG